MISHLPRCQKPVPSGSVILPDHRHRPKLSGPMAEDPRHGACPTATVGAGEVLGLIQQPRSGAELLPPCCTGPYRALRKLVPSVPAPCPLPGITANTLQPPCLHFLVSCSNCSGADHMWPGSWCAPSPACQRQDPTGLGTTRQLCAAGVIPVSCSDGAVTCASLPAPWQAAPGAQAWP